MREIFRPGRMWRARGELRDSYDVVIIGGGAHGLATAYYLGRLGVGRVAVLEQGYIGSGAAGRNTTILRSNYKTPEGARFYDESVRMYEQLSARYVLDPKTRAFLETSNPWALRSITERLLEAADRGLWEAPEETTIGQLRDAYLEVEGQLEEAQG